MSKANTDVLAERQRQIDVEGWTAEHDDKYNSAQMGHAAKAYADPFNTCSAGHDVMQAYPPSAWPFGSDWWKPKTYRENLVRAGALIIAEIERLDRKDSGS